MINIKYLILCLMGLSLTLSSCNKNNASPVYIPLPVIKTFNPMIKEIIISDSHILAPYKESIHIVNSISELHEDEIFGNSEFLDQDIDFSKYSLVIFYDLQFGKILSTKYGWRYDTDLEQYQVAISYEVEKDSAFVDGELELATFVRGAMLVDHIPAQSFVGQMVGVYWIDPET